MNIMEKMTEQLHDIDWQDMDVVEWNCRNFLDQLLQNPAILRHRLEELPYRADLLGLCEHYDVLDKIVLCSDEESGVRLRLHVFLPGYFDRPHNHRWSYVSRVLRGRYRHYIFGNAEIDDTADPQKLPVLHIRDEKEDFTYGLHHSMVHAVVAEPDTVSLVIRGPAIKDRFLVMDRKTGKSWWQHGAQDESEEEKLQKRMTPDRLREQIRQLIEWKLF